MIDSQIIYPSRVLADGRAVVVCPVCDDEWTHFTGCVFTCTDQGTGVSIVPEWKEDQPGVKLGGHARVAIDHLPRSSRRGSVSLIFDGECGHRFAVAFSQHKGMEYVDVVELPAPPS